MRYVDCAKETRIRVVVVICSETEHNFWVSTTEDHKNRIRLFPKIPFAESLGIIAPVLTAASPKVLSSAEASSTAQQWQNPYLVHFQ